MVCKSPAPQRPAPQRTHLTLCNAQQTSNSGDYYTQHSYETHTLVSRGSYHKVFINGGISTNFKDGKNAKGTIWRPMVIPCVSVWCVMF